MLEPCSSSTAWCTPHPSSVHGSVRPWAPYAGTRLPRPHSWQRVLSWTQYTQSMSVVARRGLQESAWNRMMEHPIAGVGLGGFGIHLIEEKSQIAYAMKSVVDAFEVNPIFMAYNGPLPGIRC